MQVSKETSSTIRRGAGAASRPAAASSTDGNPSDPGDRFVRASADTDASLQDATRLARALPRASSAWTDTAINYEGPPGTASIDKSSAASGTIKAHDKAGNDPATPSGIDVDRAAMNLDKAWALGVTGKGVTVAVIDSGLYQHPDLKDKIVEYIDFSNDHLKIGDPVGHGTQVAGLIAGSGARSKGLVKGAAPDAKLVGVRITTVQEAIAGLNWVVQNKDRLGIKVVNMSIGTNATMTTPMDPWAQAVENAVKAGLTVVVAAGDEGDEGWAGGSISSPGVDPRALTVGAMNTHKTPDPSDDTVWSSSSRGPTFPDGIQKPDLVAPGTKVYGPLVPNSKRDDPSAPHLGRDYIALSGASQATGFVSGIVALMLQANPDLKPDDIKDILKQTAQKTLKEPSTDQGAGVVDAEAAVKEALRRKNTPPVAA